MQGRVFNGHYLTWVDMAHTEAMRELVGGYQALTQRGIDFVVVAAELAFRQPARFDDEGPPLPLIPATEPDSKLWVDEFAPHRYTGL